MVTGDRPKLRKPATSQTQTLQASAKMRQVILTILILTGCGQTNDFDDYLSQVEKIETPITFNSENYPGTTKYQTYKKELFDKFKKKGSIELQGLMYNEKHFVGLIFNIIADNNIPFLVTYDKEGNKIDSLTLFPNAIYSLNKETVDEVTFYSDKRIQIISKTKTWDLNDTGDEIVEGTEKNITDTILVTVDKFGRVIK